jgi:hypothetical protein
MKRTCFLHPFRYSTNESLALCLFRSGSDGATGVTSNREGEAILYAKQVLPFVDLTVKGWVWYQVGDVAGQFSRVGGEDDGKRRMWRRSCRLCCC